MILLLGSNDPEAQQDYIEGLLKNCAYQLCISTDEVFKYLSDPEAYIGSNKAYIQEALRNVGPYIPQGLNDAFEAVSSRQEESQSSVGTSTFNEELQETMRFARSKINPYLVSVLSEIIRNAIQRGVNMIAYDTLIPFMFEDELGIEHNKTPELQRCFIYTTTEDRSRLRLRFPEHGTTITPQDHKERENEGASIISDEELSDISWARLRRDFPINSLYIKSQYYCPVLVQTRTNDEGTLVNTVDIIVNER